MFWRTPLFVPASIVIVWVKDEVEPSEMTLAFTTLYLAVPARSSTDFNCASSASAFLRSIKFLRNFSFSVWSFSISPRVRPSWVTSEKKFPTGRKTVAATD